MFPMFPEVGQDKQVPVVVDVSYMEMLDKLDRLEQDCVALQLEVLVYRKWFCTNVDLEKESLNDICRESNKDEGNGGRGVAPY